MPDAPDEMDATDDDSDQAASTVSGFTEYHPTMAEYLSRLGDADLLKERLWNLRAERASVVEEQISRQQIGLTLDPDSQEFLDNFVETEKHISEEIAAAEEDIRLLKMECESQGLLEPTDELPHDIDSKETLLEQPVVYTEDPLLLLWRDKCPAFFVNDSTHSQDAISITEYINTWLLHQLCQSSFEIHRLRSAPELEHLHVDNQRFRDLVLDLWLQDEAATGAVDRPHTEERCSSIRPEANGETESIEILPAAAPTWSLISA